MINNCLRHSFQDTVHLWIFNRVRQCEHRTGVVQTWVGWVNTRWFGLRALSRSAGIKARYALVPLQAGSIEAVMSAASVHFPSDWARCAFSVMKECRTADFSPSAPMSTSQVHVVPSSKRRSMDPERRWVYDRSRFEQWIWYDLGNLARSTCWKSARWKVIKLPWTFGSLTKQLGEW